MAKFKNWYVLFFVLFGLLTFAPSAQAELTLDQQCTQVGSDYDLISDGTNPREQSFIPTHNRLSMVSTWLNGPGFAGDQGVKVSILDASRQSIGSVEYNPTFSDDEPQIRTAEFEPALTLVPGQTYYIQVDTMEGPNNLYWYYGNQTCYANGTGYAEFTEAAWDYTFQTYGYTYSEPSNDTTPVTTTTPTSTTTPTPTPDSTPEVSIPKTTTSSSMKPPTNLNAVYDKEKNLIVLNWSASSTGDIDGYIISRSEDNSVYSDLGIVDKNTLSYSDMAIVAEKSYFYKVRTYKATLSSTTTDSVSVAVPAAEIARAENAVDLSSDSTNQQPKESFF